MLYLSQKMSNVLIGMLGVMSRDRLHFNQNTVNALSRRGMLRFWGEQKRRVGLSRRGYAFARALVTRHG